MFFNKYLTRKGLDKSPSEWYNKSIKSKEDKTMTKYYIYCNGFQGSATYNTYDEALNAARWRTYCTGMEWIVKEVLVK